MANQFLVNGLNIASSANNTNDNLSLNNVQPAIMRVDASAKPQTSGNDNQSALQQGQQRAAQSLTESRQGTATQALDEENAKVSIQAVDDLIRERVEAAIHQVQEFMEREQRSLNFSYNDTVDQPVITVADKQTGEVIRQIPSAEVIAFAEKVQGLQAEIGSRLGLFIDGQA